MMKRISSLAVSTVLLTLGLQSQAALISTWDLTNKSPGALGADYGLRLNQLGYLGGGTSSMIFDFEALGADVDLELHSVGADDGFLGDDYELRLAGTAFGALWDGASGYSGDFAGMYALQFTWRDVQIGAGGFDYAAELGLGQWGIGDGTGTVLGLGGVTAFQAGDVLNLFDYSGKHDHTLDIKAGNTPDASGWLTFGNQHNGDYGFNMIEGPTIETPAPGTLAVFGLGLLAAGFIRRRRMS